MGARNQVGIVWSYRAASLRSLATQFQTWYLESIPRPIAGIKIPTLNCPVPFTVHCEHLIKVQSVMVVPTPGHIPFILNWQ
jgi:hypothetical protein